MQKGGGVGGVFEDCKGVGGHVRSCHALGVVTKHQTATVTDKREADLRAKIASYLPISPRQIDKIKNAS